MGVLLVGVGATVVVVDIVPVVVLVVGVGEVVS